MTPPRLVEPGSMYLVTARAVSRTYRFVPTPFIVAILWFCFIAVVVKYRKRIAMHEFLFMSNHYHLVLTDEAGCLPDFMRDLNSLLSRALNARRGTTGTNFEKGYHAELILDEQTAITHCIYTLANACAADLVNHTRNWKSVSSYGLTYGRSRSAKRPKFGLWGGKASHADGRASKRSGRAKYAGRLKFGAIVKLFLERPKICTTGSDEQLRARILEGLEAQESRHITRRAESGKTVLGWKAATKVPFTAMPQRNEELFGKAPIAAAATQDAKRAAEQRYADFVEAYYLALAAHVAANRGATNSRGEKIERIPFPAGTWKMRVRFKLPCSEWPAAALAVAA